MGKEYLVDRENLYSLDTPDVAQVPATVEQYASELPKLTREQLEKIAKPEILDDD